MEMIGRYKIIRKLGKGSMGMVYLAHDPQIDRDVAIKTMLVDSSAPPAEQEEAKHRFLREAKSAGKLMHPSIVAMFDFGEHNGEPYIVMEFVDGGTTLSDYTTPSNLLPIDRLSNIFSDICKAIKYAHDSGIIHRDIKPANIMLTKNNHVKIMDFGLAKSSGTTLTSDGILAGTPSYMSPEQIKGIELDCRSDLFSMGVLLYQLLTGSKPFQGDSVTSVIYSILHDNPVPPTLINPELPPQVDDILLKALQKDRNARFQNAEEFDEAFTDYRNFNVFSDDDVFTENNFLDSTQIVSKEKLSTSTEYRGVAPMHVVFGNIFRLSLTGTLTMKKGNRELKTFFQKGLVKAYKASVKLEIKNTEDFVSSLVLFHTPSKDDVVFERFEKEHEEENTSELLLETPKIVFLLIEMISDSEHIAIKLKNIEQNPILTKSAEKLIESASISPDSGFIISRIDGKMSFTDIFCVSADQQESAKLFYWMILTGAISLDKFSNSDIFRDPLDILTGNALVSKQKHKEMHEMIVNTYLNFKGSSPAEILGVRKNADFKEASLAYNKLSDRFNKNNFPKNIRAELRQELELIELYLTEAHLALMGQSLREKKNAGQKVGDPLLRLELTKTERQKEKEEKSALADSYFEKALSSYQGEDYWRCIQLCENAINVVPDKAEYHSLMADSLSKNKKWFRKAIDHYLRAIELDPFNEYNFLELGSLYTKMNLKIKAIDIYKQGLKSNTGNKKIKKALKSIR